MNFLLHHLKSEYRIHAKVMWFTLLILLIMCYALSIDASKVDSVQIIWYSLVAGMVTSSAYKKDFSLKYYMAMPIPRDILILIIILGRVLYFLPGAVTLSVYYSALPKDPLLNHSWLLLMMTYFIGISIFNAIQVLGDIENPRIESVPNRFESFLMFFKKIGINYILGAGIVVSGFVLLKSLVENLGIEALNNQFIVIIYGGAILTFLMYRCHQVFLNEHLSYWSWKKDGALATLLILVSVFPAIAYKKKISKLVYNKGDSEYFLAIENNDIKKIIELHKQGHDLNAKNELGYTPILSAIRSGNVLLVKAFDALGAKIEADDLVSPSMLQYQIEGKLSAIHLAVLSNEPQMLDLIINNQNVLIMSQSSDIKTSPLHLASNRCLPKMIEPLFKYGASSEEKNFKGQTPLFEAVKANCYAVAVELVSRGANINVIDAKGRPLQQFSKNHQMTHILERFGVKKVQQNRLPASVDVAFPSTKR